MARIRSIHPSLFTDEAFMSASVHARLLIIGLWCEAWDDGVFEWKPLTLKARLFPVDAVDVVALLAELVSLRFVRSFTNGDRQFGVIRNFCKFQRPKKPNSSGVLPNSLRSYVGSSEPVPNQSGTGGEKSPQMEDGEGVGEEEEKENKKERGEDAPADAVAPPEIEIHRKGKRLDWDWLPSDDTVSAARDEGLSDDEIDRAVVRFKNFYCTDTGKNSVRTDWNPVLRNWLSDDAAKKRPKVATRVTGKSVESIWIEENSPEWAAATRARGHPPYKLYRHGKPGALVQPHEIEGAEHAA